ncbi:MAG: hypothetical protein ACRD4B_10290 [Acidobacteriota bacterium]
MARIQIKSDPFDAEFRRIVAESIQKAKKNIRIVTGEIAAYNFYDLRTAAEEAAERGVKIEVYASGPEPDIINRLINNDIDVYIGNAANQDPREHFMIRDDEQVIISEKDENRARPTPLGNKRGLVLDSPQEVKKYIKIFKELKSQSTKARLSGEDPLIRALRQPISYG